MPRRNKNAFKKKGPTNKTFEKQQYRASHAGFHFHNLYQCCQMKWFIKQVLRIDSKYTSPPLIHGSAFHNGKGAFYLSGSETKALRVCKAEIKDRQSEYENKDDYLLTLERCPVLLAYWIRKFGDKDLKRFNFIAVEEELSLTLPGTDFIVTVRPDAVVIEKKPPKELYIMETKTSSFSLGTTELGVYYGDQATIYTWAVEKAYNCKVSGIIPDIAYWNTKAKDTSNISCVRGNIVNRSERRIAQYLGSLVQLQNEIAQKIEAYKNGYDPYTLFSRNTYYCNAFFKACEFADICDNDLTCAKRLPPGLKRDRSKILPISSHYVNDICCGDM